MDRVLVLAASGLVLLAAVLTLRPLLLRLSARTALRQQSQPLPPRWLSLLDDSLPATRHLSDADRLKLLRASRELIRTRHWEGCQGVTLTEEIQLIIAAQACLLTLALPGEPFPGVREILVYPRTFVPRRVYDPRKHPEPLLGESWGNGVVVLSWEAVLEGAQNPADGTNVVLHEFAHELDFERHLTPSSPGFADMRPSVSDPETWRRVLAESYDRLCAKIETRTPSALNAYGGTNIAEFFAVATESFFEKPLELAREDSDLYAQLRSLYQQDPARTLGT